MSQNLFVLGAADPEMAAIVRVLTALSLPMAYAAAQGKDGVVAPVHPGNAYRASHVLTPGGSVLLLGPAPDGSEGYIDQPWVAVECALPGAPSPVKVIDHHRPGDPGYGKPPEEYLEASSIGQLAALLSNPGEPYAWQGQSLNLAGWIDKVLGAMVARYVAAADHCLAHAYQGKCPGVDPDVLMDWRVRERAVFQKRSIEAVMADIKEARLQIRGAAVRQGAVSWVDPQSGAPCDYGEGATEVWDKSVLLDWTKSETIPELPEAAIREGVAYLATVKDPDGRQKEVLGGCTTSEMVQKWMEARRGEGREVYGDPARGFAGAYLK